MYISVIQRQHLRILTTIMNEYAQPKIVFISKPNSSLKAYQYYLQPSLLSDEIFEGRGIDQTSLS